MPKITIELEDKDYDNLKLMADASDMRHTILAKNLIVDKITNPNIVLIEKLLERLQRIVDIQVKLNQGDFVSDSDSLMYNEYKATYCRDEDKKAVMSLMNSTYDRTEVLKRWLKEEKRLMTQKKTQTPLSNLSPSDISSAMRIFSN